MNNLKLKAHNKEDVYKFLNKVGETMSAFKMITVDENNEVEFEFTTSLSVTDVSMILMYVDHSDLMASSLIRIYY